ncbi:MAG TPA: hypothetical protein VJ783_02050 [Pirellulales bacterium]|nr:hypothetical protein [Pirellulales bacterium]
MRETWLKSNARAAWLGAIIPAASALVGGLLLRGVGDPFPSAVLRAFGVVLAAASLFVLVLVIVQARQPRLAADSQYLYVYLRSGGPLRVPLDVVEGFLLGQGPSFLPGKRFANAEAATLIVRLAERAPEWAMMETDRRLGAWCGHYITINGAWCETLSVDVANRLNARLAESKRALQAEAGAR